MSRVDLVMSWCIALVMALGSGTAFGQNRSPAGEIQSAAPAADTARKPNAAAAKVQPKHPFKTPPRPKPQLKAQTAIMLQAKSNRSERTPPPLPSHTDAAGIERCWQLIQAAVQPARLIRQSEECERDFPASRFAEQIRQTAAAARRALDIQRSIGLSGDFFEESIGDAAYRDNLGKAVRGDKDAAYLIALAYRIGMSGVALSSRRMEQWLRFSAELGSGLASWELAEFYNYGGLVADAARYEKKALELGYRPPFRLPTRGY